MNTVWVIIIIVGVAVSAFGVIFCGVKFLRALERLIDKHELKKVKR